MAEDRVPSALGKLVTNLQSLEFALRALLHDAVGPSHSSLRLEALSVGDAVPEDPITNYDSLGDLIRKVNELYQTHGKPERIDASLVDLRDAIAHGRVWTTHPSTPFTLLKFSKPNAGFVTVTYAQQLTIDWLDSQIKRTRNEVNKAVTFARSLGLACFPTQ